MKIATVVPLFVERSFMQIKEGYLICDSYEDVDVKMYLNSVAIKAVIIKNFLKQRVCKQIINELNNWRKVYPAQDKENPYPKNVYNLHLPVFHQGVKNKECCKSGYIQDFDENYTNINVYNYRLGNIYDPVVLKHLPAIYKVGPSILAKFNHLCSKDFEHGGATDKNIYFEFAHYRPNEGFIEKHTHHRNIDNGQNWNLLTVLTQEGEDHVGSGLKIEDKDFFIDTTSLLSQGDAILFRMDVPHFVDIVQVPSCCRKDEVSGRWTVSLFYY